MDKTSEKEPYVSSDPKKDFDRFKQALSAIVKVQKPESTKKSPTAKVHTVGAKSTAVSD